MKKKKFKSHPTRDRIARVIEQCRNFDCKIPCSKCEISSEYKKIVGIRMEEFR